ncbi:unnamed protein product [Spodoptera littoralis]|uniref:Uncharacterized protein n=1 Tax=Spodoptera littoralis TaxID=7109 RepID=A0A9P0N2L9_SPOLI|nr:unnamed protein product [Spodoptera littoralis]
MILRLVFSFFFLSVVTGNPQLDVKPAESAVSKSGSGTGLSSSKEDCSCEDQDHNNLVQTSTQVVSSTKVSQSPELRLAEVPHPQQYAADELQIAEKTICVTPTMIQNIVKAALTYVTQIPLELNNIVDQIDQEINKMSVIESKKESIVRQSAEPTESQTIYQMINKPRSHTRTNLLLQYDLPGEQRPNCIEALEKLIEIAYKAYLEIEHQPQCRDYLYKFASTYKEDRPRGYLENGQPDIKSLIFNILEEIQKQRPVTSTFPSESDRYGGFEVPTHNVYTPYTPPVTQVIEHTISPVPERLPNTPTLQINEYTYPQPQSINFPAPPPVNQIIEHTISPVPDRHPNPETLQINEYTYPQPQSMTFPAPQPVNQIIEHTISPVPDRHPNPQTLQINEYTYPQPQSMTFPAPPPVNQIIEHTISPVPDRHPNSETLQINEYTYPQPQSISFPAPPPVNQIIEHTISPVLDRHPNPQTLQINEYTYPQPQSINFPAPPPVNEIIEHTISPVFDQLQNTQTLQINEYTYPRPQTITFPAASPVYQVLEHTISPVPSRLPKTQTLQINEYTYPQPQMVTLPPLPPTYQVLEHLTISPVPSRLPITQTLQLNDHTYPRPQMVTLPPLPPIQKDTIMKHTTMPIKHVPIKPIQPEGVINLITKLLQTSDKPNNGKVYDHITKLVELNPNIFHPQLLKHITTILKTHKQSNVPRIKDLLLSLLSVQQKPQLKDACTETLLTYLQPNNIGQYDARLVDVLLYLVNKQPSLSECNYISSILNPFMTGLPTTGEYAEIAFNVIRQIQTQVLTPEQTNIITTLLTPYLPDLENYNKEPAVIVAKELSKWNGMGISPKQFNSILNILRPAYPNSSIDQRAIDIIYFLLINGHRLIPESIEIILMLLSPQNGIVDSRRLDFIHIIFNELLRSPKHGLLLLSLLIENGPYILNSKYVEILIILKHYNLITIELLDVLVKLLNDEINGQQLDNNKIQTLIHHVTQHQQNYPQPVADILALLNQGGLPGTGLQLLQSQPQEPMDVMTENSETHIPPSVDFTNEYRTPDDGYQTIEETNVITPISPLNPLNPNPEDDLVQIFKWLESHGLLNPDQTSNNELVNKILKILQLGERELGVLELTYMLKHAKPLIYQPVYYVKYRLPILNFISNMKTLLVENPNLNADPMKLLQELIVVSNVTEVSPNLQGFPKEEILKLTLYDGDLIQAKILDEQNMSLNEQITYVHTLNADISPEELLQLNEMNEAKFFPNLIQTNGPSKLTILGNTIDKFVEFPPVQYQQVISTSNPGVTHETHTVHQTYIERTNQHTTPQSVPQTLVLPIK